MWHIRRFKPTVPECFPASQYLILITGNLIGRFVKHSHRFVVIIDGYTLGAVYVINNKITLSTAYLTKTAAKT